MSDHNHNAAQDDSVLLHLAVIEENLDVVKFLLKHGVSANGRAMNKNLALEFLTDSEHQKFVELSLGDVISEESSKEIEDEKLEALLSKTTTSLHLAARNEDKEVAEILLQNGAEVNAEMEGGETPLMIAVLSKRQNLAELLIEKGADVNAKTIWGKSALHYAAQSDNQGVAELLIKHGAHINSTTCEGLTPLHIATEAGYKDVVVALLRNEADYKIRAKNGATALHIAAVMGHKEIMEIIIDHGADINTLMRNGMLDLSPFSWITPEEERKTLELVSRYTTKMSIINWYNTMVMKLYKKKEKKSMEKGGEKQEQKEFVQ